MEIYKADKTKIEAASKIFDLYRQFYGQPTNINASAEFLSDRFEKKDSRFFIALSSDGEPLGFIQLYPSFSSVAMKTMWYLNDLFVMQSARGKGVASALLDHVKTYAKDNDSFSLKLATAVDNVAAKALYEKHGYRKVTAFDHYVLRTDSV
eukprot:TRINITY_DN19_c0_g2_i3.p6 TRINITY_DN19_c0_g2~~TRINITY_DN19_c0_g2_i3.p6  ORF type:complete len:151 (+),score=25.33 TRINITY_DN19_c0_g2_i3:10136-10588(+)